MAAPRTRALPRGPHQLSRDEVRRSQRERLLEAMTEAVAEKGYANTVVADVVARSLRAAGVRARVAGSERRRGSAA